MIIGIFPIYDRKGYIAGSGDGIVTVGGQSVSREITLMNAKTLAIVQRVYSLVNGHYLILNLEPANQYLIMCRDLPPDGVNERYEPVCWDYVTPMTDKTFAEQQELWRSMTEE